ncbi:MAG: hypothetical protein U1E28_10975 [Beijerinckiaceae bacterium]
MLKSLLTFVLAAFVALGSSAATTWWLSSRSAEAKVEESQKITQKKTRPITVPMLGNGQVNGYVIAQFGYAASEDALKKLQVQPEPFILDEGFRMIYEDDKRDFHSFRKTNLAALTTELRTRVARRLKSDAIQDLVIVDFNYVSKDQVLK